MESTDSHFEAGPESLDEDKAGLEEKLADYDTGTGSLPNDARQRTTPKASYVPLQVNGKPVETTVADSNYL